MTDIITHQDSFEATKEDAITHLKSLGISESTANKMVACMVPGILPSKDAASYTSILRAHTKANAYLEFCRWQLAKSMPVGFWVGVYNREVKGA